MGKRAKEGVAYRALRRLVAGLVALVTAELLAMTRDAP